MIVNQKNKKQIGLIFFILSLALNGLFLPKVFSAKEKSEKKSTKSEKAAVDISMTSKDYVRKAWQLSSMKDFKQLDSLVNKCLEKFEAKAIEQQNILNEVKDKKQKRGEEDKYQDLNDIGTCLFIRAEALMNMGKTKEAIAAFEHVIKKYPSAQAWDPSRGSYWLISEKSHASINILTGKVEKVKAPKLKALRTVPKLHTLGKEKIIDYTKYGEFKVVGTADYEYKVTDIKGLSEAIGEGIYPNTASIYNNPRYKVLRKEGRLKGKHWDFVNSDDLEAAYIKWATAPEPWGVRLFYLGMIFEKAKMYHEALRAYHALVVHFPKTVAWTYWQTPWYPGQAAIAKIKHIIRMHPELSLDVKFMKIQVKNCYDNDVKNDVIIVYPGKIVKKTILDKMKYSLGVWEKVPLGEEKRRLGKGEVCLAQYENGHWQLLVKDKPFVIKGVTYAPTKIGQSPDKGSLANWMEEDTNENGKPDGPYDAWVDKNKNNKKDKNEKSVGDFQLMKEMGVNTIRLYHNSTETDPKKDLLRLMYKEYGFKVIMGDFLGKYTLGSGATWFEGTDYENKEHCKNMLESVKKMVMKFKDEPYILMWVLGNENNYGVASNADKKPEAYFSFVNEVAKWIKSVDPNHPVAVNNGDTLYLDIFAKSCPDVDIFTGNVYRGDYGFGSFWDQVAEATGKPAFITEYGCPAYASHLSLEEAEIAQEEYHRGNWYDISANLAGSAEGVGNALGGVIFEYLDEWWKNYDPMRHDKHSDAVGPFPGGFYFEEWFGIVGQGNGQHSPFLRQLRKTYYFYKQEWNRK